MSIFNTIRKNVSIKNILSLGDEALNYTPNGNEIRYNIGRLSDSVNQSAAQFNKTSQSNDSSLQAGFPLIAGIVLVLYMLSKGRK